MYLTEINNKANHNLKLSSLKTSQKAERGSSDLYAYIPCVTVLRPRSLEDCDIDEERNDNRTRQFSLLLTL